MNREAGAAEDVTKAADRLAQEVGALLDGPPNGASWPLRRFLAQWASVQQALTDYWDARKP